MSAYSKAIGTVIGALVGILFTYLASKGFATCDATGANCTVFGLSEATVSAALISIFGTLGTVFAPKNSG